MRISSPFALDTEQAAFAAYCKAPHMQRANAVKPSKAKFKKLYAERHAAAKARVQAGLPARAKTTPAAVTNKVGAGLVLFQGIVYSLGEDGVLTPVVDTPAITASNHKQRLAPDARPVDAARNTILWALNTEGLLNEALELASNDGRAYITQADAQSVMGSVFGPQA